MSDFKAKRFTYRESVPLAAPADEAFPLLCPVREPEWLDGWSCDLLYTDSGVVEDGCVFITHAPGEDPTYFVTTVHDPADRRVVFVRLTPGQKVILMELRVDPGDGGASRLTGAFTVTALAPDGNALVDELRATGGRALSLLTRKLAACLEHFVRTGTCLPRSAWPR